MKRLLATALVLLLAGTLLAGCSAPKEEANNPAPQEQAQNQQQAQTAKLGLGIVTSIAKSKDATADATAVGQVDSVIAAALFDKDGKVVKVDIDTAQPKVQFDKNMKVTSDKTAEIQTKKELGDKYGMIKASSIKKEWYQQIAELEKWMVGKTVDEIKAMKVKARDEEHQSVPDVPELTSSVTISVEDYIAAVEKAYQNAVNVKDAAKLGLGHNVSIAKSKDYSVKDGQETLPVAQADVVVAAVAFDKDGKVAGAQIDTAQTKVNFDKNGKVTSDKTAVIKTKKELGDAYGMGKVSSIGKNWYQQIAELEKWMAGKTVDEIKALKVKARDEEHTAVPDVPELTSLVTISVEDYIAAVAEAYTNAK
ncbi:hypothetical protein [Gelria sp. Kuro-4]|uniref:hypothetical protein n=1 Tax=Gelria sp. Kuro-4 TaxID=2796927 RepID=UPI001BEEE5AD|nr:hypothetical protein [Gelria sp. Kuro-4]BCV23959.1 hypothetical protein kuro4_07320 [Gelria sp. Kuro-4]